MQPTAARSRCRRFRDAGDVPLVGAQHVAPVEGECRSPTSRQPGRGQNIITRRERLDRGGTGVRVAEVQRGLTRGPSVEGVVVGDHGVAGPQRLDQRRVGAADRVTVQVDAGVVTQRADPSGIVDGPGEENLVRSGRLHGAMVGVAGIERSEHGEPQASRRPRKSLHELQDVVLRLDPRDRDQVAIGFEAQGADGTFGRVQDRIPSVGDRHDGVPRPTRGAAICHGPPPAALHSLIQNQALTGLLHFERRHSIPSMLVMTRRLARRSQGSMIPVL